MTSQGSSLSQADVDRVWIRVLRAARNYGLDSSGWNLRVGTGRPPERTSWCIEDKDGECLLALGYTRRTAYDGLTVMGDVFDLLNRNQGFDYPNTSTTPPKGTSK